MSESQSMQSEKPRTAPPSLDGVTLEELKGLYMDLAAAHDDLIAAVGEKNERIAELEGLLRKYQRMLFGKKSEKVVADDSQGILPGMEKYLGPEGGSEDGEAGDKAGGEKKTINAYERKKGAAHRLAGWEPYADFLPQETVTIDDPKAEAEGLIFIGYNESRRLVHRCEYLVRRIFRAKYADPKSPKYGVLVAPAPEVPSCLSPDAERCHYDASVIAHVISEKMLNHMPFYRQSMNFKRMGISFGRSMMCEYFKKVSEALTPLYDEMVRRIMACPVLHADETRVEMLDPGGGGTRLCWIWVRKSGLGPPLTAMYFSKSRGQETARNLLGDYQGTIIRDGYDSAYGVLPAEVAACWAHARRKFHEAQDNHPEYASRALELVRNMYRLEKGAKESSEGGGEKMLFKARREARRISEGYVEAYFDLCAEIVRTQPPKSAIVRAAAYSLERREELERFLGDPRLNIDNNPVENVIRPLCLGRKNWLFVGNEKGGTSMAVLSSFAATCKDNGVDFEQWLLGVMYLLDKTPSERIGDLLPHAWREKEEERSRQGRQEKEDQRAVLTARKRKEQRRKRERRKREEQRRGQEQLEKRNRQEVE